MLLEREREIAAIDSALAACVAGTGWLQLFEGPAGIGKTALLEAARGRALDAGLGVASARGGELEGDFPYAVIRQLFEPVLREATAARRKRLLAGAARFAAPVVLWDDEVLATPADASFAVIHGLYWLVANLASEAPLVLVVDDIHWADAPSLRFLIYLARRLEGLSVTIIASNRPGDEGLNRPLVDELDTAPSTRRAVPAPLSEAAVAEMLAAAFNALPDAEFSSGCSRATGGNPLLVRELVAVLVADGVEPNAGSRVLLEATGPQTIARATLGRLARLSDHAAAMARAIALLGRDATLARAARLAELDDDQALGALDILVAADFVGVSEPIEFRHPIVRAAIYNELAPGTRTLAHRRVADMLAAEGADINATASHLLLTQPIGSAQTVAVLRKAAADALGLGAPASAATYLARAIDEAGERELRARLLLELGLAEKLAGDAGSALQHLDQARAVANDPVVRTRAAIEASMIRVFAGDWQGPFAVIEQALLELGDRDPGLALATEASLAVMMGYDARLVSTLDSRLPALRDLADRGGLAAGPLLMTLAGIGALRGEPSETIRTRVARAWDDGRFLTGGGIVELLPQGCYGLLICDDLDGAQQLIDGLRADAQARGSLMEFVMAATMASTVETRRGSLSVAEAELRVACDRVIEHGFVFALPTLLWGSGDVLVERPAAASVAALVETLDPAVMPNSFNVAVVLHVRGRLRFIAGDHEAAVIDLRTTGELMESLQVSNPNAVPWRSTLALMLPKAERGEAIDLVERELEQARAVAQPRAIGVALRALGMLAGAEDGLAHLEDAARLLAGSPARLEHARALVELGAALRRGGSRATAREPLREGLELAARCGATRLQERARQELSATGAKPRRLYQTSRDALTPSELRVASLAAEGRTNKQIAQLLFVTNKTIEAHLQHSYVKLGINSRKQLKEVLTTQAE